MNASPLAFASGKGLYPIGEGGGETIAHDLLAGLSDRGLRVEAFGIIERDELQALNDALKTLGCELDCEVACDEVETFSGNCLRYPVASVLRYRLGYDTALTNDGGFLAFFDDQLAQKQPPVALLQAERSRELFETARKRGTYPIFYAQNGLELRLFQDPRSLPLVLANSKFFRDRLRRDFGVNCELLYPAVNLERYIVDENSHEFVTMINPIVVKGIVPFLSVAAAQPHRQFLAVEGWGTPPEIRSAVDRIVNLTHMHKQLDMRNVYGRTHILMVPSQWDEAFGRVITEAQINGIPVLASKVGGIPEAVGAGGVLVEDIENPDAWLQGLRAVESRYIELSALARENARRFSVENAVTRFLDIVNSIQ
jgi:glycosyltransferase involved in cell wall biosynthesis